MSKAQTQSCRKKNIIRRITTDDCRLASALIHAFATRCCHTCTPCALSCMSKARKRRRSASARDAPNWCDSGTRQSPGRYCDYAASGTLGTVNQQCALIWCVGHRALFGSVPRTAKGQAESPVKRGIFSGLRYGSIRVGSCRYSGLSPISRISSTGSLVRVSRYSRW